MPDDETKEMSWDLEKGTVTLKKGEATKTFDLSKEEERISFMKLGQRGWYYDEDASKELGQLRQVINNWDSAIEAARKSDEAMVELVDKLETLIGRPLTRAEKKGLDEGDKPKILMDDEENAKLIETIDSLRKELAEIKKAQADLMKSSEDEKIEQIKNQILKEASELEKKYDGKDGSPRFEKEKVFEFAAENNIEKLELAFKLMNFDRLTEYAQKQALREYQEKQSKRRSGFVETGDGKADINLPKPSNAKSYHQLGLQAFKSAKEKGLNLFTED